MNILLYVYTLISLVILDSIWLFSMGAQYRKWLDHLFASSFNLGPAAIFYLMYAAGIVYFVITPALRNGGSFLHVFLSGAFLGLLAYGAYDLTNQATLKNWPLSVTLIDMSWGMLLTGLASVIVFGISTYFK